MKRSRPYAYQDEHRFTRGAFNFHAAKRNGTPIYGTRGKPFNERAASIGFVILNHEVTDHLFVLLRMSVRLAMKVCWSSVHGTLSTDTNKHSNQCGNNIPPLHRLAIVAPAYSGSTLFGKDFVNLVNFETRSSSFQERATIIANQINGDPTEGSITMIAFVFSEMTTQGTDCPEEQQR